MPLLVANIPKDLRTPDLRNYFSEYIEKDAFIFFHFRHRPEKHLKKIMTLFCVDSDDDGDDKGKENNDNGGSNDDGFVRGKKNNKAKNSDDDCDDNDDKRKKNFKNANNSDNSDDKRKKNNVKAKNNDDDDSDNKKKNNEKVKNSDDLDEGKKNNEIVKNSDDHDEGKKNNENEQKSDDRGGEDKFDKTESRHWLTSGLSGLSALIDKTKKEAKSKYKTFPNTKNSEIPKIRQPENTEIPKIQQPENTEIPKWQQPSAKKNWSLREYIYTKLSRKYDDDNDDNDDDNGCTCCVVVVKEEYEEGFITKYNNKHWVNRSGDVLPQKCYIFTINFNGKNKAMMEYKTKEGHGSSGLDPETPKDLIELHPPPEMPQGNTGTPTQHFRTLISSCQLPTIIIKKLGLTFPRSRGKKRFSQVPFDYGSRIIEGKRIHEEEYVAFTASGHHIPSSHEFRKPHDRRGKMKRPNTELEEEREDGAEVEEWERYEAFHEDVTSQGRIKERRYEEEMEVTWEKGGPGLVFYTDSQYWRQQQGDFDEQTTDEWDVDMSVYYEQGGGDKDAHDSIDMLHSDKLRAGSLTQSAFTAPHHPIIHNTSHITPHNTTEQTAQKKRRNIGFKQTAKKKCRNIGPKAPPPVGKFEEHTRGFGRRVMEAQGWKDGQGLGKEEAGLPYALDNDGQHPHDKRGFGYHGEKLQGWGVTRTGNKEQPKKHQQQEREAGPRLISTIFDPPDPPPPTLRTGEPTTLSHRSTEVTFMKSMDDS